MKLLMTQLTHQDPLKPMDHEQFSAQLAQFSSLEQLTNIGQGIQGLRTGQGDEAKLQALSMIGKSVRAPGNEVQLVEGQSVAIRHSFGPEVTPTKASIYDSNGKLVREMSIPKGKGSDITWDGKNTDGGQLPAGKYTFRVTGTGKNGDAQDAGAEVTGKVTGMEMDGQVPTLIVQTPSGQTKVDLAKIKHVLLDESGDAKADPKMTSASPKTTKPASPAMPVGGIKIDMSELAPQEGEASAEAEKESNADSAEAMQSLPFAQLMERFRQ